MRAIAAVLALAVAIACSAPPSASQDPATVSPRALASAASPTPGGASTGCVATPQDVPANYVPNAPVRSTIGSGGYMFRGTVRSAAGCSPLAGARVELWLANPSGSYDSDHRATVVADGSGRYTVNTSFPATYGGGRAHIHIRVTADRHRPLVSVFFPPAGTTSGEMDLILEPD